MKISATVTNSQVLNANVSTNGITKSIELPQKPDGSGSAVNGGELLFLSLATCFSNDLYREAKKHSIKLDSVQVDVVGEFGNEGEPAKYIEYRVQVAATRHTKQEIHDLIKRVDELAEIHGTLRRGIQVTLVD